jgi:predicted phage-related endonuclease
MKLHRLDPGSPEWHAHRNSGLFFNASEAPMMMGHSPHGTRADLLHRLHTGIKAEFSDFVQERVVDPGHEFERLAKPIAEKIIGDDLFPIVGSERFEILLPFKRDLSASFDGLTMEQEDAFEHKSVNDAIRTALPQEGLANGEKNDGRAVGLVYRIQMEQQLAVCAGRRVLFMASKFSRDGQLVEVRWCWYYPDPDLREQILRGWAQFATDLADYKPGAVIVPATAIVATAAVETLPVPVAALQGEVKIRDNLDVVGEQLRAFVARIPKRPTTDDEFAFAKGAVKKLGEFEKQLAAEETRTLAGLAPVQVFRQTVATQLELSSRTRLDTEKLVTRRETEIKTEQITRGKSALAAHVAQLNDRLGKPYMPTIHADFAGAISGKRTHSSLVAAIDQCMATAKIEANRVADGIEANLKWLRENAEQHKTLFPDTATIVLKAHEDLQTLVTARIAQHKQAEAQRLERERERIRAEEQAKAEREARAKLEAEQAEAARLQREQEARDREAAESAAQRQRDEEYLAGAEERERQRQAEIAGAVLAARTAQTPAPAPIAAPAPVSQAAAANSPTVIPITRPTASAAPTLRLGMINERLAPLQITADGLATLGFPHALKERSSVLYHEADYPRICHAIAQLATNAALKAIPSQAAA